MKFAHKLSAVAGLAMAAAAYAQPASFTDLGDRSTSQVFSQTVTLNAANNIQWFKIVLPAVTASSGWVDIYTNTPGDINDSELGLYDAAGNIVNGLAGGSDDDSGPGLFSQLTYGQTTPTRPAIGTGAIRNGIDGVLAGGTYWVAVGRYSVAHGTTNWTVTSTYTGTQRTTTLNFDIAAPGAPTPPTGVGAYTPNNGLAGTSTVATVTVTPGDFPPSTGMGVTLDGSLLGAGSITLLDDGNSPDAVAGDNIFSGNVLVDSNITPGVKSTPFTVSDAQSRSSNGAMNFTVNAPPPANDDCVTAATANLGANPFNNSAATNDGLTACVTSSRDVWFVYTAANTNDLTFATCGNAGFDTVVSVYDECGGTALGCNDDGCGVQSTVTLSGIVAGETYYVRVAGFGTGSAGGAGSLVISETAPPTPPQWDENTNGGGDSGDAIATAQVPTGTDPFVSIGGTFNTDDVDIYKIRICGGGTFSITTNTTLTGTQDTQLFMFDTTGAGVVMNDDTVGGTTGLRSTIDGSIGTPDGTYYLAVTRYDRDPLNAGGFPIWEDTPFQSVRAPDGLTNGGDITLASWAGTYTASNVGYELAMTGVCFASDVCVADYNADTVVDFFDYLDFVADFSSNAPGADFNADTVIDLFDYLDFVAAFSTGC
jgi:hypothetical protein